MIMSLPLKPNGILKRKLCQTGTNLLSPSAKAKKIDLHQPIRWIRVLEMANELERIYFLQRSVAETLPKIRAEEGNRS